MSVYYRVEGSVFRTFHNDPFSGSLATNFTLLRGDMPHYFRVVGDKVVIRYSDRLTVYSREDGSVLVDRAFSGLAGVSPISDDGTKIATMSNNTLNIIDIETGGILFSWTHSQTVSNRKYYLHQGPDNTFYFMVYDHHQFWIRRFSFNTNQQLNHLLTYPGFESGTVILYAPAIDIGENFIVAMGHSSHSTTNSRIFEIKKDLSVMRTLPYGLIGRMSYFCLYDYKLYFLRSSGNSSNNLAWKMYFDFLTETTHSEPMTGGTIGAYSDNYGGWSIGPICYVGGASSSSVFDHATNAHITWSHRLAAQPSKYTLQGVIRDSLNQPAARTVALYAKSGLLVRKATSNPVTGEYSFAIEEGFSSLSRVVFSEEPNRNDIIDRINFT